MALAADLSSLPTKQADTPTGWTPDAEPRFVHLLAEQWRADDDERGPKPRATADSRFRHSDAGKCARAIALTALDVEPSDPMDITGTWNTNLGTLVHDAWQAAILARYPDAEIETVISSVDGEGSGHIDAVIRTADKVIACELKTIGGFGFKSAVGADRRPAEGPKFEHMAQASLNGAAVDADEVVIGYLAKECISVNIAKRKGLSELGRFCAEWTLPREQYEPIAADESERIAGILDLLDQGTLPARAFPKGILPAGARITNPANGAWEAYDAAGQLVDTGTWWACGYCSHQTTCTAQPTGRTPITDVALPARKAAA